MTVLLQTPVSGQVLSKQANLQPGAVPAITPEATARENSVFKAGTEISSQADDNAANNDRHKLFDAITVFQPFASWSRTGPRLTSALHYSAGIGFDHQIPIRNMLSQAAEADVLYRFSRRISAHVTGQFTDSSNPFDRLRSSELAPGSSLIAGPNTSVFATAIRTTFEDMNGAVTYRLSRKSSVGAGSSFDSETYRPLVETSVADRTSATSTAGRVFYSRQFSQNQWTGFEYSLQDLLSAGVSRSLIHSAVYTHLIALKRGLTMSFAAGPQWGTTQQTGATVTTPLMSWYPAAGAALAWTIGHTTGIASLSQRISEGAGVIGAVHLQSATVELRRRFTEIWELDSALRYARNRSLAAPEQSLTYFSAAVGCQRMLARGVYLRLRYWRESGSENAAMLGADRAEHNRAAVTLAYQFAGQVSR